MSRFPVTKVDAGIRFKECAWCSFSVIFECSWTTWTKNFEVTAIGVVVTLELVIVLNMDWSLRLW